MEEHIQYGIVATCHCEEYECGNIKIHEKTRKLKEEDRYAMLMNKMQILDLYF